jgi:hypothetical protein
MAQSLIAIATFVALVGGVIFGVKQFEKKSEQDDNIELLNKPYQPLEKPIISSTVPDPVGKSEEEHSIDTTIAPTELTTIEATSFEETAVADPWGESDLTRLEEPAQTVLDLGEIPRAERVEESYETITPRGNCEATAPEKPVVISDQLPLDLASAQEEIPATEEPTLEIQQDAIAEEPVVIAKDDSKETEIAPESFDTEPAATELDWANLEQPSPEAESELVAQTAAIDPVTDVAIPNEELAIASLQEVFAPESVATDVEPSESVEPRHQVSEVIIPPTIQDPKRPSNQELEDLTQEILAWGQTKELKHLPKLIQNASHSDSLVRGNVAIALGQISASHPVRNEIEQAIPVLGKLAQDSNLQVRQFAVQSLGTIQSDKVLPYLQQALLSPSTSVMKAANDALQNLKLHYGNTPAIQTAQQIIDKAESTSKRRDS